MRRHLSADILGTDRPLAPSLKLPLRSLVLALAAVHTGVHSHLRPGFPHGLAGRLPGAQAGEASGQMPRALYCLVEGLRSMTTSCSGS